MQVLLNSHTSKKQCMDILCKCQGTPKTWINFVHQQAWESGASPPSQLRKGFLHHIYVKSRILYAYIKLCWVCQGATGWLQVYSK